MSAPISITIDGRVIQARPGQSILQAAQDNGIYIPRLCEQEGLKPAGACRLCTVRVNGRPSSACTQPVAPNMVVENDTPEIRAWRLQIVEMLFVEGNHFCMFCEKSGNCELQAVAYRLGMTSCRFQHIWPKRDVDASHPDIILDRNRCILCGRCERASRDLDGKSVFGFVGRGAQKRLAVNASTKLVDTNIDLTDHAVNSCPVGAILRKNTAYRIPIGRRHFDHQPIGAEIEARAQSDTAPTTGSPTGPGSSPTPEAAS